MHTLISACVDLVTVNGRPYSVLNDSGFKKIINPILDGLDKKVARQYVHEESLAIQKEIRTEAFTKAKLISLKLDAVTKLNRSFLGINIQYIVGDYIKLRTLALIELTQSHTGFYLKEIILNVLKKYNIEHDQIYTITSDNGAKL
ncbi:uncharacterized protein LOC126549317 [Aphis gossypii]|uniref:uncharacterized protein LOC126549317 n=1 Tax=Aphis gossypii TaxID=80765 RepID=UPI00215953DE|nr:uncharacterized protein LOC126549317 [Aphis gossypii]